MGLRKGREFYDRHYSEAMKLHGEGLSVREIADKLGVSYSAAYHWIKGIRRPEQGNVSGFVSFLEKHGPAAVADLKEKFPKHNEVFLIATRRARPVKRYMMKKMYGDYSTWYYLEGQEAELEKRISMLMDKIKEVKEKLTS